MRAASADDALRLVPPRLLNLEQAIEFINGDEFVEATLGSIRLRKRILAANRRPRKDTWDEGGRRQKRTGGCRRHRSGRDRCV